jgi:transcriptional regulator with XRE-family HTH domain
MAAHIPERYFVGKGFHTKSGNGHTAPAQYHRGMPHRRQTNRLKTLREQRGLSQAELAKRVGVKQATISRYETDDRSLKASQIYRLATVLEVHPGEILQELPASGLETGAERAAAEIARRLRHQDLQTWLTTGVAFARDRKIVGKIN